MKKNHNTSKEFLEKVNDFISSKNLSARKLGLFLFNDNKFFSELRDGRDVKLSAYDKVCNFIESYNGEPDLRAERRRNVD